MTDFTDEFIEYVKAELFVRFRLRASKGDASKMKESTKAISTKLKFKCKKCGHKWTTAHGTVRFLYSLKNHRIYFRVEVYSQLCIHCKEAAWLKLYE